MYFFFLWFSSFYSSVTSTFYDVNVKTIKDLYLLGSDDCPS